MTENRSYKTKNLLEYFRTHRVRWDQFYPSERHVLEKVAPTKATRVLDMGCACGGLGVALRERFGVESYTGIELNEDCAHFANELCPWGEFHAGDFLEVGPTLPRDYDLAFSLSCADWNVRTEELLSAVFGHVRPGGKLVISCRLTDEKAYGGCLAATQEIVYPGVESQGEPEYAAYKVYTWPAMLKMLSNMGELSRLYAYGYWGQVPASVKGLPLKRAFYAVIVVDKASQRPGRSPEIEFEGGEELLG